jgi:hypothetical protein
VISTRASGVAFAVRSRRQGPSAIVARVIASAAVIGAIICVSEPAAAQFTQQGPKLVGSGAVGGGQGSSVAVSADGNTAIVGGPGDNFEIGAVWVFTRSNGVGQQTGRHRSGWKGRARQFRRAFGRRQYRHHRRVGR